jgi:hypothetical protein
MSPIANATKATKCHVTLKKINRCVNHVSLSIQLHAKHMESKQLFRISTKKI